MIEITHLNNTNSSFGFFSSLFLIILLQRRFFGPRYIGDDYFVGPRYIGDDFFFRADRSFGGNKKV